ncbi:TlpA disulfide reductase family protein [Polynucleobacter sp. AM-26B4]|uniref:TlpA family protein disulfide reductase n=1 Tax=Polynucleobacter sp. AM-26B4 TaxID=2689103 RepID=UPI001C0B81E6|nr:TlpA disulfide reductase family protein [Polynucleobacter sp. AM-26B4]MBU3586046.1 TlpA family protein disulfide reductase [Polynucleobacter sp. AM-26B4]
MQGLLKSSSNTVKLIMLLGMAFTLLSSQARAIEVGDRLPLGQIQSIQGETFTPENWAKRNTIVQVWATWCSYCRTQNKYMQQLRQKVPAQQLNIVTISIDRRAESVKDYMEKNQYSFPVVMMTPELSKAIGKRRGVPELYVVDPQGRVIQKDYGLMVDLDFFDLARHATKAEKPAK